MGFSGVDAVIRVLDHQLKTTLEREATERWASDHYIEGKVIHIKLQKIEILVEAGCVEEAKACIAECQIPKEQLWGFYGRKYGLLASKAGDKKTAKKTMVDLQEIGDELSACMIAVKLGDSESAREYLKNNLSNCNDEQDISDMGMLAIEIGDDTYTKQAIDKLMEKWEIKINEFSSVVNLVTAYIMADKNKQQGRNSNV